MERQSQGKAAAAIRQFLSKFATSNSYARKVLGVRQVIFLQRKNNPANNLQHLHHLQQLLSQTYGVALADEDDFVVGIGDDEDGEVGMA